MDIKDRGTKKWTSLMLPEHVQMLKELEVDLQRENKPVLDEYQLQDIDERLRSAQEFKMPLIFELWYDGFFEDLEGIVERVDHIAKLVWVVDHVGDLHKLKYDNITAVEFAE